MTAALIAIGGGGRVRAQDCTAEWTPGIMHPGAQYGISAIAVFDLDGPGPEGPSLLMGGGAGAFNGVLCNGIAAWNGIRTRGLDEGYQLSYGTTRFVVLPANALGDGGGPSLYAVGNFTVLPQVPGDATCGFMRWEPGLQRWQPLYQTGFLVSNPYPGRDLIAVDLDGDGPAPRSLVAVVSSNTAAGSVIRWTGSSWEAVGINNRFNTPEETRLVGVDHDGNGPQPSTLYVCTPRQPTYRLVGDTWIALPTLGGFISDAVAFDLDGDGPKPEQLLVCGTDLSTGAFTYRNAMSFDGVGWNPVGVTLNRFEDARCHFMIAPAGTSPGLARATLFMSLTTRSDVSTLYKWNGSGWIVVGTGLGVRPAVSISSLLFFDPDGDGPGASTILAAGSFNSATAKGSVDLALLDRGKLFPFFQGGDGLGSTAIAVQSMSLSTDAQAAQTLFVAASFDAQGARGPGELGAWNGERWTDVWPTTLHIASSGRGEVRALAVFDDDGAGPRPPALYAGGNFETVAGVPAESIARLDAIGWSALGEGLGPRPGFIEHGSVEAMTVADLDGPGPRPAELIVVGQFGTAGGGPAASAAAWDGVSWRPLGALTGLRPVSLAAFDPDGDGSQPLTLFCAKYNGGLGRFDGTSWTETIGVFRNGPDWGRVESMATFDPDGAGPVPAKLYVGGFFASVLGVPVTNLAVFDGVQWSDPGFGDNQSVGDLRVLDLDGTGPLPQELVMAGNFKATGGSQAVGVWNGASLRLFGGYAQSGNLVGVTTVQETPGGPPSLYLAGIFDTMNAHGPGPQTAAFGFARLGCPPCVAFIEQPVGRYARQGDSISLHVAVRSAAAPPYAFRWKRNGVVLSDGSGVSGAATDTLRLAGVRPADAGTYNVTVASSCGEAVSSPVILEIWCDGDTNRDGSVFVQDLFDYIGLFFTGDAQADVNRDFAVTLQDLFDFLDAFISACG